MAKARPQPWSIEDFLAFEAEEAERYEEPPAGTVALKAIGAGLSLEAIYEGSGR